MRLRIMPALMAGTTCLIVATTILFGLVVNRFASEIIAALVDSQFSTIERSVSTEVDGMIGRSERLLRELRTLAEQDLMPVDDTRVLGRRLAERLRQLPQLIWISYGEGRRDRFVGATRNDQGQLLINHSEAALNGGRPEEFIVENDGSWLPLNQPPKPPYSVIGKTWYEKAIAHDAVQVTGPYDFAEGRMGLTLSLQVVRDGQPSGVFTADFLLDDLSRDLAALIGRSGDAVLLDGNGAPIASAGAYRQPSLLEPARKAFALRGKAVLAAAPGTSIPLNIDLNDQQFHARLSRVEVGPDTSWVLVALASETVMDAPLAGLRRVISILGIALAVAGVAVAALFAVRIARPLNALSAEADRIRSFDFENQLPHASSIVEVDNLIRAMIAMKATLRSFGRFVPRRVVKRLVAEGGIATLGGDRRELTVMFSDIAGFTRKSEGLPPEQVMQQISRYFDAMAHEIQANSGIVDKFIGDGIMALWNAPRRDPDHAKHACEAVLACMKANDVLDAEAAAQGLEQFPTRYGLHGGEAVVGNIGSADRMQYTALGAVVNLASRLESLNKHYRTRNLVSAETRRKAGDTFLFRNVAVVMPAGTTQPIAVFELMGSVGTPEAATLQARVARWEAAMAAFRGGHSAEALAGFQELASEDPHDGLAAFYIERAIALEHRTTGQGGEEVDRFGVR